MIDRSVKLFGVTCLSVGALVLSACSQSNASQHDDQATSDMTARPAAIATAAVVQHTTPQIHAATVTKTTLPTVPVHPEAVATVAMNSPQNLTTVAPVTAAPLRTPQAGTGIVQRTPHAAPAIVRIVMPSSQVASGEIVHATVYTTSNTASVEARLYGYAMPLQRVSVGHFRLVYQVPEIPFYLKRQWPVQVIARNVDGHTATKQVTISVH